LLKLVACDNIFAFSFSIASIFASSAASLSWASTVPSRFVSSDAYFGGSGSTGS